MIQTLRRGERMVSRLSSKQVKQAFYLAGYFGLLFLSVNGLLLQRGLWMFAGMVCWSAVFATCFLVWFVNGLAKNLRDGTWQNGCN
jgi:hypothetical protein